VIHRLLAGLLLLVGLPARANDEANWHAPFVSAERMDTSRIIGGRVAPQGSFPAALQLYLSTGQPTAGGDGGDFACGASVIAPSWALTAAHCVVGRSPDQVMLRAGATALGEGGRSIPARRLIVHEAYLSRGYRNDIALIELATPADVPAVTLPDAVLAQQILVPRRDGAVVVGWGNTRFVLGDRPDAISARLLQVQIDVLSQTTCEHGYTEFPNDGSQFCAGVVERCPAEGSCPDSCQGDSGGPLFIPHSLGLLQAGIVSYGDQCGKKGRPGVYTSIAHFSDWIRRYVPEANIIRPVSAFAAVTNGLAAFAGPPPVTGQPALRPSVSLSLQGGTKVRVNQPIAVLLASNVSGQLLLFTENADGGGTLVVPNRLSRQQGTKRNYSLASVPIRVPDPILDGWELVPEPPLGPQRMIAMIVPPDTPALQTLLGQTPNEATVVDIRSWVTALTNKLPAARVAVGEISYEIVP
jgi:Trypsin